MNGSEAVSARTVNLHGCLSHIELIKQYLKEEYDIFTDFKIAANRKH